MNGLCYRLPWERNLCGQPARPRQPVPVPRRLFWAVEYVYVTHQLANQDSGFL
jgi:hypothetical protein